MIYEQIYQFFQTLSDYANRIARVICFPMSIIFVGVILLQVLFRYVLQSPIEWYLEIVEISYMWALFMGITVAYKSGSHIQFIFLFKSLGPKPQRIVAFSCQLLSLFFFLFMIIAGFKFFDFSKAYVMPTIEISQQWKFLCVPISGLILLIHTLDLISGNLVDFMTKSDTKSDFFRRAGGHSA